MAFGYGEAVCYLSAGDVGERPVNQLRRGGTVRSSPDHDLLGRLESNRSRVCSSKKIRQKFRARAYVVVRIGTGLGVRWRKIFY